MATATVLESTPSLALGPGTAAAQYATGFSPVNRKSGLNHRKLVVWYYGSATSFPDTPRRRYSAAVSLPPGRGMGAGATIAAALGSAGRKTAAAMTMTAMPLKATNSA